MLVHGYQVLQDRIFGQLLVDVVLDGTEEPTCCGGIGTFFLRIGYFTRYGDGVFNNEDGEGLPAIFSFLLDPKKMIAKFILKTSI